MNLLKRTVDGNNQEVTAETGQPVAEPRHLTDAEFDMVISMTEQPVVVDFWAEWCGPCHAIAPSIVQLAKEYEGRAVVGKLDADEYPDILMRYGIMGIPTVMYFKGGQEVDRVVGLNPYGTLKKKLDRILG